MSGRWATSDRRSQLPPDWSKRVAATRAKAQGRCQAEAHDRRCNGWGDECDHRTDPLNHDDLQWLNHWCHNAKTQAEAKAARPQRTRPPEQHPGRLT